MGAAGDRISPDDHTEALETVRKLFWAYYRFAREHPQFFELMFLDRTVPQFSREWEQFDFVRR